MGVCTPVKNTAEVGEITKPFPTGAGVFPKLKKQGNRDS